MYGEWKGTYDILIFVRVVCCLWYGDRPTNVFPIGGDSYQVIRPGPSQALSFSCTTIVLQLHFHIKKCNDLALALVDVDISIHTK